MVLPIDCRCGLGFRGERDGLQLWHLVWECIDIWCDERWKSALRPLLVLSPFDSFFVFCWVETAMLISSMFCCMHSGLVKRLLNTTLVVRLLEYLSTLWIKALNCYQVNLMTRRSAQILSLSLKPGLVVGNCAGFLRSDWVSLTICLMQIEEWKCCNTIGLIVLATTRPTSSTCPCLYDRMAMKPNGYQAFEIVLWLCKSTVVLNGAETWAWSMRHNKIVEATVESGMAELMNSPRNYASGCICRSCPPWNKVVGWGFHKVFQHRHIKRKSGGRRWVRNKGWHRFGCRHDVWNQGAS